MYSKLPVDHRLHPQNVESFEIIPLLIFAATMALSAKKAADDKKKAKKAAADAAAAQAKLEQTDLAKLQSTSGGSVGGSISGVTQKYPWLLPVAAGTGIIVLVLILTRKK